MKIIIIYDKPLSGDISDIRDISDISPDHADVFHQVRYVKETLSSMGNDCTEMGFSLNLEAFSNQIRVSAPDLIFNLVESVGGKGSLVHLAPAILDAINIPYTGSKTDAIYMTSNKLLAKGLLRGNKVPTPGYFSLEDIRRSDIALEGEYIIKSVWEHASIGLDDSSVIRPGSAQELFNEMKKRRGRLGGECFVEKYIEGREFNLSMLAGPDGPRVLPPAEMRFNLYGSTKRKIVGYDAKWAENTFEYNNTIRAFDFSNNDSLLLDRLKDISIKCWELFNIRGYCRVDFRVDEDNQPWVLEVNANPCISPDAGFMAAVGKAGLKSSDVITRIITDGMIPS